MLVTQADQCDRQPQTRRLFRKASTCREEFVIGVARQDYIDFIHSKYAGRAGRRSLGRYRGLEPVVILLPISDVRKRRITPAKLATGTKLDYSGSFADRCTKPNGIFALCDHLDDAILNK